MAKYSVIIPVYNVEEYLGQCIESVLGQSFADFELILVNDGSTDNSGAVCEAYANKDNRVHVIHQVNRGQGFARNVGIMHSIGEYVIFVDSDDWWLHNRVLERIDEQIVNTDIVVFDLKEVPNGLRQESCPSLRSTFGLASFYESGREYLIDALKRMPDYKWYPVKYAFHMRLWKDHGIRFPEDIKYEDPAIMYRPFLYAKRICVIKEAFYAYRKSRIGATTSIDSFKLLNDRLLSVERPIEQIKNELDPKSELFLLLSNNFATGYFEVLIRSTGAQNEKKLVWKALREKKWLCKYSTSKKQLLGRIMVNLIGVELSAVILGIRKWIRKKRCSQKNVTE